MMQTVPRFLGQEFNRFLFAPVGVDRDGGSLSVVSALARLDLDAWAEAAALARLPRAAAIARLSELLRKNSEIPHIAQERVAIAARLVALLPGSARPDLGAGMIGARGAMARRGVILGVIMALGVLVGLEYASWAPNHQPASASQSVRAASHAPLAANPP